MTNNKYDVLVIGCSGMARFHINSILQNERTNLYAVCGIDVPKLEKINEEFKPSKISTDYKEFLDDPKVDIAILVVPDNLHLPMTEAFLRAGKAVLCEKPFALTVEECVKMREVEKETGGRLMVGQVARSSPQFIKTRELILEGRIGEIMFAESEYAHNYEVARGFQDWRVRPERHPFIGGGCHSVDMLTWICGYPTEVVAFGNKKYLTDWPIDHDSTIAAYKFPNGAIGKVFVSTGCKRQYTNRLQIWGTKGTILCDGTLAPGKVLLWEDNPETGHKYAGDPLAIPVEIHGHNTDDELKDFVTALDNGTPFPVSSWQGMATVCACVAAVESANRDGEKVVINYPAE